MRSLQILILLILLQATALIAQPGQSSDTTLESYYENNLPVKIWVIKSQNGQQKILDYDFEVKYNVALKEGYSELPPDKKGKDTTKMKSIIVEQLPEFPGGNVAMQQYLSQNKYYPPLAQDKKLKGTTEVRFIVQTDGTLTDIEVMKSAHPILDKEAVRLVRSMPLWIPAKSRGKLEPIYYRISVEF